MVAADVRRRILPVAAELKRRTEFCGNVLVTRVTAAETALQYFIFSFFAGVPLHRRFLPSCWRSAPPAFSFFFLWAGVPHHQRWHISFRDANSLRQGSN